MILFDPKFFESAVRSSLDNIWPWGFGERVNILFNYVIRIKLTNAHTVRGRPTLNINTQCLRNGLVPELKKNNGNRAVALRGHVTSMLPLNDELESW